MNFGHVEAVNTLGILKIKFIGMFLIFKGFFFQPFEGV